MALKHAVNKVNIILFCGAVFCLFALYRLTLVSDQYPPGGLSLWLVIAAALFLVCSLSLAMPTRIKTAVVLIGAGTLVGCYLAEIIVFVVNYSDLGAALRERLNLQGPSTEGLGRLQAVNALQASGFDAYPSFHPCQCLDFDGFIAQGAKLFPLAGISRRLTVFCATKQIITYQSDRYGFNNPDHMWDLGEVTAVLVGDSFTQGSCVPREKNVAGHLQEQGCGGAINLGQSGSGPLLELAILIEYAQNLRPKNLVWLYFEGNDMFDLLQERKSAFLMRYLASDFSQGLVNRQEDVDQVLTSYMKREKNSAESSWLPLKRLFMFYHLRRRFFTRSVATYTDDSYRLLQAILAKAKQKTDSWGGRLILVYIPYFQRYVSAELPDEVDRQKCRSIAAELGLIFCDVDEALTRHPDPLDFFDNRRSMHFNSTGYKLVADLISQCAGLHCK
jgi:hypothetical protein